MLKNPKRIIVCEKDPARIAFVREHYPEVLVCEPEDCKAFTLTNSDHGGANMVLFLASDKAGFITGENICMDGGQTRVMIYHGDHGWMLTP